MQPDLETDLARVFEAVRILAPSTFSLFDGPPIEVSAKHLERADERTGQANSPPPLVLELESRLYFHAFARDLDSARHPPLAESTPSETIRSFAARLSAANRGRYGWDPGWRIYRLGVDGEVQVKKGDRHRWAMPGEYAFLAGPGSRPQVGDLVHLQVLKESDQIQSGMYFAFGQSLGDRFDEFEMVRFYFHSEPDFAPLLVEHLTANLNRFQIPFHMKCQQDPANYDRKDASVLYIAKRHFDITARVIANLPTHCTSQLKATVPLFSKCFCPGIAVADDPGDLQSFGMHRCRLLAQGIVDAWERGSQAVETRLEALNNRFVGQSLDLRKPYLNPGSVDIFDMPSCDGIRL